MKKICMAVLIWTLISASALALTFTDANDREVTLENPQNVVSLYHSYGAAWRLAGGELAGSIADTFEDGGLGENVQNLGSHVSPNMELLFSLDPDFVLLSAEVASHREIAPLLEQAGIPCAFFSTPDYQSYMEMMELFCMLTDRADLYQQQIEEVQKPIEECIAQAQSLSVQPTALLIRANSTSVKFRGSDGNVAGNILRNMGFVNLADGNGVLSENIGMESVLMADPDYIFVVLQGANSEAAEHQLAAVLTDNPAWNTLNAVQEGHVYLLDRALFHYHPNEKWAQAYQYILEIRKKEK